MLHVQCDICSAADALPDFDAFEAAGWKFTKPRGTLCPDHAEVVIHTGIDDVYHADHRKKERRAPFLGERLMSYESGDAVPLAYRFGGDIWYHERRVGSDRRGR